MITKISGNIIRFLCEESDIGQNVNYTLPDGYTLHKFMFNRNDQSVTIYTNVDTSNQLYTSNNIVIICPIISSKSPNSFIIRFSNASTVNTWIELIIFELGGIPDSHYFDKAFNPVLIKSKDENDDEIEYNMIQSTQFER